MHSVACPYCGREHKMGAVDGRRTRNGEYVWRGRCKCGAMRTVRSLRDGHECAADMQAAPDGHRLRDARAIAGLTIREVASLLAVSHQRVSQWENEIRVRDIEAIVSRIKGAGQ